MKKVKSLIVLLSVIAVVLLAVSCSNGTPTPRFSNFTLYTVTAKDGDYVIDSVIVIDGNTYSLPIGPDKVGYSFVGWKVGESMMAPGEKITVTKDTEIDAYYAKTYNCIVDYAYYNYIEKYDVPAGTQEKISIWDIDAVAKQFKINDTFLGWILNGEEYRKSDPGKWNSTVTITEDSTMTAIWQNVKYNTVTFYDEDGTTVLFTREIADKSAIGEMHSPYKEGYTLEAWVDKNGEAFDLSTSITGDMPLKAKWKLTSCVVTLDFDNGAANQKHVVTTGKTFYEPKTPVKEGYDFGGWYNGDIKFDFSTPITTDIKLTAKWEHKTTYTVTFDAMGKTVETQEVDKNSLITKPSNPTRNGYTFGGWYLSDGTAFNFNSTIVTENITLYALWNLDKEYEIGETGLGGGKVFYDAGSMQISSYVDKNGVTRIYTWRYLEVNTNVKDKANWAYGNVLTELGGAIGQGRSNTMKMARTGSPAADIATSCEDGGVSDWFIPSLNELGALGKVVNESFGLPGAAVWASTSFSSADAYYYNLYTKCYGSQFKRSTWRVGPSINVLLVRAF